LDGNPFQGAAKEMGAGTSCCYSPAGGEAKLVDSVPIHGKVVVKVLGARGVRPKSWQSSGQNECVCVISLGGREVFRTKPAINMLEPVWQQETEIDGVSSHKRLEFSVHDNSGCLGKATMVSCQGLNGEIRLQESQDEAMLRLKVRHCTEMGYLSGPPTEFKLQVQRDSTDVKWGMRLDTQGSTRLLVDKVELSGPIVTANSKVEQEERRIGRGDVIMSVNDIGSETSLMMKEFIEKTDIVVTVRRSVEVFVCLERTSLDTSLGMAFPPKPKGSSLLVINLIPGLVQDYNAGEPDKSLQVQVGDRVVAVNGEEGTSEGLVTKLSEITGMFRLTIRRIAPAAPEELVSGKAYWYYGD